MRLLFWRKKRDSSDKVEKRKKRGRGILRRIRRDKDEKRRTQELAKMLGRGKAVEIVTIDHGDIDIEQIKRVIRKAKEDPKLEEHLIDKEYKGEGEEEEGGIATIIVLSEGRIPNKDMKKIAGLIFDGDPKNRADVKKAKKMARDNNTPSAGSSSYDSVLGERRSRVK